jgi:sugar (pentulose or hexulose) kinase
MSERPTGSEVLAIDAGTQGTSIILWCPERRLVLGVGEAAYQYDYIPDLPDGRLEQYAHDWTDAMVKAMRALREDVRQRCGCEIATVAGIGVTGHMHCMVRRDAHGNKPFGCDMWNDPRGVAESLELTALLGEHLPSRWTACHLLASMRTQPESWRGVAGVTVTSGSLVHDLTGDWVLGPGDASGMFGALGDDGQIDVAKLRKFDAACPGVASRLESLVPRIVPAGNIAARLSDQGAELLGGLPAGIPVAPPEGDQQSVLVGAAADELELALSAGTSFAGNLSCRAHLRAESETINVLHTPDGLTMLMICARNGTIGFAQYVTGLAELAGVPFGTMADLLTDLAAAVPPDVYGIDMLPFFQGENVAELPDARASLHGAGLELVSNPGVMARLLLEGPCLTMRYGLEQLRPKIGELRRVILSGGVLKSKNGFAPQIYADLLGVPVVARTGDEEGTAKGAAILAAYMVQVQSDAAPESLAAFARSQATGEEQVWQPRQQLREVYDRRYAVFAGRIAAAHDATSS